MAIAEFHFTANNSLGRMHSATILVPEKKQGPFPVLYLLHGMTDDHTAWTRRSNIDRYVESLPLIVVMPDTERGWYSDALRDPSKRFESYFVDDMIPFVDSAFHTKASRDGRAIAGLSMGGYGALSLAFKHPDLFCIAHGFSSGFDFGRKPRADDAEFQLVYGESPAGGPYDLFAIAEKLDKSTAPVIRFDTGVDDFVLQSNRDFHAHLTRLGVPHEYAEYPGSHNWAYWNEHILDALPAILDAVGVDAPVDKAAQLT